MQKTSWTTVSYTHLEDTAFVRMTGFGDSSINLMVSAYLRTADLGVFLRMQNDLNLNICLLYTSLGLVMELHGCQRQVFEHRHVGVEVELLAVSYTHLDVYKRQAVDCAHGSVQRLQA